MAAERVKGHQSSVGYLRTRRSRDETKVLGMLGTRSREGARDARARDARDES